MTYNFKTNIELRVPGTDRVYAIQRMTSEWAERNTFDVDAFVSNVAQRHGADAERVRKFFNYGLGRKGEKFSTHCPAKHTDRVVKDPKTGIGQLVMGKFPDYVNGCEPALIEAWNKGAEYHTKGFRMGDTLPDRLPMCKITCQADGSWVALFPKELHLLDDIEKADEPMQPIIEAASHQAAEPENNLVVIEPEINQAIESTAEVEPILMEAEPIIETVTEPEPIEAVIEPEIIQTVRQRNAESRRRRREEREARQRAYEEQMAREAQEAEDYAREQERKKIFAAIGAAAITLVLIYFFGLLGPAVFGLLAGGVLKG